MNHWALKTTKDCEHCFVEARKWTSYLWDILNCQQKEHMYAQDIWESILMNKNFKEKVLPRSANDFILAVDQAGDMAITREDFVKAIFRGMFERLVGAEGLKEKSEILGNRDLRCDERKKMGLTNECENKGA